MSGEFNCTCCGECCRGDMHVYLNPDDLILIARFLGLNSTRLLFERSIVIIDDERDGAPRPRLRFGSGRTGCCPFLENRLDETDEGFNLKGLCRLHPDHKPLVCILAPLFRTVELPEGAETWGFKQPLPGCPGCAEMDEAAPDGLRPDGLDTRLESETAYFKKLAEMLEMGALQDEIVSSLYYINIKQ